MIKLNFPDKKPSIKKEGEKELIFCPVRKKWLQITPEEWVRQNLILYLVHIKNYPLSLISVEKKINMGEVFKRYDIVVFNNQMQPNLVIECKEMNVPLSANTLLQVINYNRMLQAPYFIISNGSYCAAYEKAANGFREINDFPEFSRL